MFDYCDALGADYAMVCNGYEMFCYKYLERDNIYEELNVIPKYQEMLEEHLKYIFGQFPEDYFGEDISKSTPM